jgi:hypothetical protein
LRKLGEAIDNSTKYLIDPVSSQDNFRLHWNEGERHE